ncbi:ABC transporter permease [archaeon]|nr:ABC transporter permease [archaeon]
MDKIRHILIKNFKQILRTKVSSLIILIGPILIILLAGFAFNSSGLQGISVGMNGDMEDRLNKEIRDDLQNEGLGIKTYSNIKACTESVKSGENHVCLFITEKHPPSDLTFIDDRYDHNVSISADYSKTRIIWTVLNKVNTIIEFKSKEITYTLFDDLSGKITYAINELENKEDQIDQAIRTAENVAEQLEDAEGRVGILVEQTNNAITELNSLEIQLLSTVSEIESISGQTPQTQNMISTISTGVGSIKISLTNINENLNGMGGIHSQITYAKTNTENLVNQLKNIRSTLSKISNDFEDFKGVVAKDLMEPIQPEYSSVSGEKANAEGGLEYFDYILPGLILIVIMFSSILLGSTNTIGEKKNRAYIRNILSPTSTGTFLFGSYLTALIILSIQILVLLIIAKFIFFSPLDLQGITVPLALLLSSSLFILIGTVIGHIFKSEDTTIIASVSIGILLLITSSMIMSVETIPYFLGSIVSLTPFVLLEDILRKLMIFQLPLTSIFIEAILIIGYIVSFTIIAVISQNKTKYKETF